MTLDDLRQKIRDNMEAEWLNRQPTRNCFDYSGSRMELLANFIEKDIDEGSVRAHLIECCRCRYIYCNLR